MAYHTHLENVCQFQLKVYKTLQYIYKILFLEGMQYHLVIRHREVNTVRERCLLNFISFNLISLWSDTNLVSVLI